MECCIKSMRQINETQILWARLRYEKVISNPHTKLLFSHLNSHNSPLLKSSQNDFDNLKIKPGITLLSENSQ